MSRFTPLFLLCPLALAACGGSQPAVKAENASIDQVAKATQDAVKMEPGEWETQIKFVSVDVPGMPKAQADMMGQQMAKMSETTHKTCITAEMVSKPPSEMFGGKAGSGCTYDTYELAGGKLNAVMTCKPQGAGEMKATTTGTINSTSYELTSDTVMSGMPGMPGEGKMTSKTQIIGKRIGDCPAAKG
ncbi:DUF3617 domain-containing protein [Sphingomonas sp.]|uniref:DUF3617 domain-containing protein n=1 Tax=Sphingomonas sp. TaxID=28214 RepID=UPI0031D5BC46